MRSEPARYAQQIAGLTARGAQRLSGRLILD